MWETLHLFSRYGREFSVTSTSSVENTVSAYTTVNSAADSMTIILVNRDMNASRDVTLTINGFFVDDGKYPTLQLSLLPSTETFKSHTTNALKKDTVLVESNTVSLTVPKLSTTAILLTPQNNTQQVSPVQQLHLNLYPNPVQDFLQLESGTVFSDPIQVEFFDPTGRRIISFSQDCAGQSSATLDVSGISSGYYLITVKSKNLSVTKGVIIQK
jgi:hypothetical protein